MPGRPLSFAISVALRQVDDGPVDAARVSELSPVRGLRLVYEVSMAFWGFGWCLEALGEQDEGGGDEGDDADDVEAVHEGEQLGLGVELVVDAAVGCGDGVGWGEAVGLQVGGGLVDVFLQAAAGGCDG